MKKHKDTTHPQPTNVPLTMYLIWGVLFFIGIAVLLVLRVIGVL